MTDRKSQLRTEIMNRLLEANESLRAARNRLSDHNYEDLSIDRWITAQPDLTATRNR